MNSGKQFAAPPLSAGSHSDVSFRGSVFCLQARPFYSPSQIFWDMLTDIPPKLSDYIFFFYLPLGVSAGTLLRVHAKSLSPRFSLIRVFFPATYSATRSVSHIPLCEPLCRSAISVGSSASHHFLFSPAGLRFFCPQKLKTLFLKGVNSLQEVFFNHCLGEGFGR